MIWSTDSDTASRTCSCSQSDPSFVRRSRNGERKVHTSLRVVADDLGDRLEIHAQLRAHGGAARPTNETVSLVVASSVEPADESADTRGTSKRIPAASSSETANPAIAIPASRIKKP